jgi:CheY-like chemotaxis protein
VDWICDFLTKNPGVAGEIVKSLPSVLWFLFACFIVGIFYRPIVHHLFPQLASFKAMGIEMSFVRDSLDNSVELAEKSPQWKIEVSSQDKRRVLARAGKHISVFKGAHVLWIDDHPENNLNERKMFRGLGVEIDIAKSTTEALSMAAGGYDLIFSDMARGDEREAGSEFLARWRLVNRKTPVIFYVGDYDAAKGVPGGAFGITNRPDELLHLSLDALERQR